MNDVLGIKPYGEAIQNTLKETLKGLESFLAATCMPALEEMGLMLRDNVRVWRLKNIVKIVEKAKGKLEYDGTNLNLKANPKVALAIVENGSNEDNDELQEMWAGLFASSLSNDVTDDENLMYVNLLKQLTVVEARYLRHLGENTTFSGSNEARLHFSNSRLSISELMPILGINNINLIENILLHLVALNLVKGQYAAHTGVFHSESNRPVPEDPKQLKACFCFTTLGMQLYLRCIGYKGSIIEYGKRVR